MMNIFSQDKSMMNKRGIRAYQRLSKPAAVYPEDATKAAFPRVDRPVAAGLPRAAGASAVQKNIGEYFRTEIEERAARNKKKKTSAQKKSGARKAAELLLLVGKDEASNILQHMSVEEVRSVIYELARIKHLDPKDAKKTLAEFGREADERGIYSGGVDIARGFLKVAFGENEGERILRNAAGELLDRPFAFLEDLELAQLLGLLKDESVETLSVILPRLTPSVAKVVLEHVHPAMQADVVKRIAAVGRVDSAVIIKIEEILRERIRRQGGPVAISEEIDGHQALANILRHMSISDEKKLLGQLATDEPEMAKTVEDHLITIDSLLYMTNRDLHEIFRRMEEKDIGLLIKGKTPEVRERILESLSVRKRNMVLEEEQLMGPMRKRDVDKATREFLEDLREKERQGKVIILRPGESLV